jgi:hypothetical protein
VYFNEIGLEDPFYIKTGGKKILHPTHSGCTNYCLTVTVSSKGVPIEKNDLQKNRPVDIVRAQIQFFAKVTYCKTWNEK